MRTTIVSRRGFTLVELMIVVAIIGVLAALAIYGVTKYVSTAKTVEARNALGQISKDVTTSYMREAMSGTVLPLSSGAAKSNALCPSGPKVPSTLAQVSGQKYQSRPVEWSAGWQCLRFAMQDPQYYMYEYTVTNAGNAAGDVFVISATGNLDNDSVPSRFEFQGAIVNDAGNMAVLLGPNVAETNPEE